MPLRSLGAAATGGRRPRGDIRAARHHGHIPADLGGHLQPYDYAALWELLRSEGLENKILSSLGVWTKLPDSMWAAVVADGADAMILCDALSARLTAAALRLGLNVDLCVLISDGWAWNITEGKQPELSAPNPFAALAALRRFSGY